MGNSGKLVGKSNIDIIYQIFPTINKKLYYINEKMLIVDFLIICSTSIDIEKLKG